MQNDHFNKKFTSKLSSPLTAVFKFSSSLPVPKKGYFIAFYAIYSAMFFIFAVSYAQL
jgi:hypothetical protein